MRAATAAAAVAQTLCNVQSSCHFICARNFRWVRLLRECALEWWCFTLHQWRKKQREKKKKKREKSSETIQFETRAIFQFYGFIHICNLLAKYIHKRVNACNLVWILIVTNHIIIIIFGQESYIDREKMMEIDREREQASGDDAQRINGQTNGWMSESCPKYGSSRLLRFAII